MASRGSDRSEPIYDRDFLLGPTKQNELIELVALEKYGQFRSCNRSATRMNKACYCRDRFAIARKSIVLNLCSR